MSRYSTNFKREEEKREELLNLREPICYDCEGCKRVDSENKGLCTVYIKPEVLWGRGSCHLATHIKLIEDKPKRKIRVGQQKQKRTG